MEKNFKMMELDKAVLNGTATWWQMDLPAGDVIFGDKKAEMLGYPASQFEKYQDFIALLDPDDNKTAMQAMRDHLDGKKELYEVAYKIKTASGEYIRFYDCGQIVKKDGDKMTVMGFVIKVDESSDPFVQMKNFRDLIIEGNPSIIEIVKKMKG